jgi:hypothetical protein
MKKQIREGRKATKDDLRKVGRRAGEADFQEDLHEGLTIKGRDVGAPGTDLTVEDAQRHAEMLRRMEAEKARSPTPPPVNPERISASVRTAVREGTEAIGRPVKVEVKLFPKQTVPGSTEDFVSEVTEGKGTSKIKDQLNDPKKLASYLSKNAGQPEAWSVDYMKENWKGNVVHSPGFTYPFRVEFPWGKKSFKTEMEARQYLKKTQAGTDAMIKEVEAERKAKGIPADKSLTEWNNDKRDVLYFDQGKPVTRGEVHDAANPEDFLPPCQ